ncbi:class I SAM-dependent methyltransferase [Conexibacter sp. SYSU D00693]|uniref:class I SAM-dependent methyltransferase n=1 Tax=Conexibacter sp. SYSU D00693 TaxID=2812560 RepID=UPI00196B78BB|nr:class I SAM-dependent methyltransferase [Conexibacter sp. SYSU D00693]
MSSAAVTSATACSCCGAADLRPHLAVAGEMGEQGLIPTTDAYGTALADIVKCARCGHMQLEPMPADEVLESAYADAWSDAYVEEADGQRETARRVLAQLERHQRPGDLLDLGCWVGFLLAEARDRGWDVKGVEPSDAASNYARETLGLDVVTDDLFTAPLPSGSFDAIVLGDVIEHLPRPAEALERFSELLRPGGVLAMMLPDAGSRLARRMGKRWWSVLPTHVQYFTRSSMRTLLETNGWTVLDMDTQPKAFSVRYYLSRIEGYSKPVGKALVRGAEAAKVADRMWAPDFGDRMLVVARRPG